MATRPNVLILMTDQMQGRVLDPEHPCRTPHLDRLAARGVRFPRAYTPNAICSPARASLMTGLLPHSHGVTTVNHCTHDYECTLQEDKPHWAQRLQAAGYRTGLFGKWHVERTDELERYGWEVNNVQSSAAWRQRRQALNEGRESGFERQVMLDEPAGYTPARLYGLTRVEPERRGMGVSCSLAAEFLAESCGRDRPWCCFVSVTEPHDPFDTSQSMLDTYDLAGIEPPANWFDDLAGRPGMYRKAGRAFASLSLDQKKEAAACYWASITEIDQQFGHLLDQLEAAGELDRTIVIMTSDHGEFLGAHGLYQKNVSAFEEAYQIPLIVAGPGLAAGAVSEARVGSLDIGPTLLDLLGLETIGEGQSKSFASVLAAPDETADYQVGYAEYYGVRYWFTQRIIWDGDWKLVWNGFDVDELYDLRHDPQELVNRIDDPACDEHVRRLMRIAWRKIREFDDHPLGRANYGSLRLAPYGPGILDE